MVGLQRLLAPVLLASTALAGVLDPGRPDSKVARNVLEGKSEGYCSVRIGNDKSAHDVEPPNESCCKFGRSGVKLSVTTLHGAATPPWNIIPS